MHQKSKRKIFYEMKCDHEKVTKDVNILSDYQTTKVSNVGKGHESSDLLCSAQFNQNNETTLFYLLFSKAKYSPPGPEIIVASNDEVSVPARDGDELSFFFISLLLLRSSLNCIPWASHRF